MTDTDLIVERLAKHRTVGSAPREQLEWLATHGVLRRFAVGDMLTQTTEPLRTLFVVLSGHLVIRVDRGGGPRKVLEWRGGDVAGFLPFSRLTNPPGRTTVEEDAEVLAVDRDCFPDMISHCQDLTASFVHVMLDRARRFTTSDFHDERMRSLGRLSAGLAHELNNPASAVARSARELSARVFEMEAAALALGAVKLTPPQLAAIARTRALADSPGARAALSPLERADREEAVAGWLERHGLHGDIAEGLAETALTEESLEPLAGELCEDALGLALRSIASGHRARALASEVEIAASRIHKLVAAIKGFSHMDRANVSKPVALAKDLADTVAMLGAKAREKSLTLTVQVAEDLPQVEGFGSELNQVWMNLIDNAIDAAPPSGRIEVSAERRGESLVVRIADDGPGVPGELIERIFDPFFTTKPMGQGTGLGLDIARRLVRQHDGQIEVESRPGRTEFRVILPRAGVPQ